MNPNILSLAMDKIVKQTGLHNLGKATGQERKLNLNVLLRFVVDVLGKFISDILKRSSGHPGL